MSGYLINGVCHPSIVAATAAWEARYPLQEAGFLYQLSAPAVGNSVAGTIAATFTVQQVNGVDQSFETQAITLVPPTCDLADLKAAPQYSLTLIIASVVMFGLGFARGNS